MSPSSHYLRCEEREIHYVEWGDPHAEPLFMWHGLARTCRDFDDIATVLAERYRVICPDNLGRGLSQWSPLPDLEYCLEFYALLATSLMDQLRIDKARWIGTSMGGAIGIKAAASTLAGRISHLVLNDIGTSVEPSALERIKSYAGKPPRFETVSDLEKYLRIIYQPYGWQSDAQWRRMAETSVRRLPDGGITTHYDPSMVQQFFRYPNDYELQAEYERLRLPVLVLRGENSDLLSGHTAQEMTRRGPKAKLLTVPGCGHAPCLNVPSQIDPIVEFLQAT